MSTHVPIRVAEQEVYITSAGEVIQRDHRSRVPLVPGSDPVAQGLLVSAKGEWLVFHRIAIDEQSRRIIDRVIHRLATESAGTSIAISRETERGSSVQTLGTCDDADAALAVAGLRVICSWADAGDHRVIVNDKSMTVRVIWESGAWWGSVVA